MSEVIVQDTAFQPGPESDRELVTFWLDMHPWEFQTQASSFLDELAAELDVSPSSLWVVGVDEGCTKVTISVKKGMRARIESLFFPKEQLSTILDQLQGDAKLARIMQFKQQFRIVLVYDPVLKGRAPYVQLKVKVQEWPAGRTVTWLHLSDLHMKNGADSAVFFQDEALGRFSEQLPSLLDFWNLAPDFVFFTGDVAFSGQAAEYKKALSFLEGFREKLPKRPAVFSIPGNHDVDRKAVNPAEEQEIRSQLDLAASSEAFESVLTERILAKHDGIPGKPPFERLAAFCNFVEEAQVIGQPALNHGYYFTDKVSANGVSMSIAGLNSAWRCEGADLGNLAIGHPQMSTALKDCESYDADVSMALVHHPPDSEWFNSFEQPLQRSLLSKFDFVLHGHQHQDRDKELKHLGDSENLTFSAGALYVGGGFPKTFKAIRFNLDECSFQVYFWRFIYEKQAWVTDSGPFWPWGYYQAMLGAPLRKRHLKSMKNHVTSSLPKGASKTEYQRSNRAVETRG